MSKNRRWVECYSCENWQPVREDAFFDDEGDEWQECEFCETDFGPRMLLISGFDAEDNQMTTEEKEGYEQRINRRK
jgi:hypothetical protein